VRRALPFSSRESYPYLCRRDANGCTRCIARQHPVSSGQTRNQSPRDSTREAVYKIRGQASSLAVDDHGDVVAAGFTRNSIDSVDFTVAKFDREGMLLWLQNLSGNAVNSLDFAHSVVVDHQGNVVAAGSTENTRASGDRASDLTVAKFGPQRRPALASDSRRHRVGGALSGRGQPGKRGCRWYR
jgi:hypothetical protein